MSARSPPGRKISMKSIPEIWTTFSGLLSIFSFSPYKLREEKSPFLKLGVPRLLTVPVYSLRAEFASQASRPSQVRAPSVILAFTSDRIRTHRQPNTVVYLPISHSAYSADDISSLDISGYIQRIKARLLFGRESQDRKNDDWQALRSSFDFESLQRSTTSCACRWRHRLQIRHFLLRGVKMASEIPPFKGRKITRKR